MKKKVKEKLPISIRYVGHSHNWHTNVWNVQCECGKCFQPPTTMLSKHHFSCPRCGTEYYADYNAEPVVIKIVV